MEWLALWILRRRTAWAVVLVTIAAAVLGALSSARVRQDDDLLAFLPRSDEDIAAFREINETFGGLDVAIVGLEVQDPLDPAFFARLQRATRALDEHPRIDLALSLANVQDFRPSAEGGIETDLLVPKIPADSRDRDALRERVLSREIVVGRLIGADGHALVIYAFAAYGADPRVFAEDVRSIVERELPGVQKYWGGAPFVSSYIFEATQRDLRRLTPWAVLVIVVLILLSFRDAIGATLALVTTGMGIAITMGLMGILDVEYNLVLSSMPVILFALGSAYSVHVLACYYRLAGTSSRQAALVDTLRSVGPTVICAGLTTVAGLASFVAMDIQPLRTFGFFTAFGILVTLVLSLTFVPAVIRLANLSPKSSGTDGVLGRCVYVVLVFARRWRRAVAFGLALLGGLGLVLSTRIDTRMDQSAFFAPDSAPARADRFLARHFGGSTFVQIHVKGNFEDPHALLELERVADELFTLPFVADVQHAGQVVATINEAMAGSRRIPDDEDQVRLLYGLLAGTPGLSQLVTADRQQALLHVKLSSSRVDDVERALASIERLVGEGMVERYRISPRGPRAHPLSCALARVRALARRAGIRIAGEPIERGLSTPPTARLGSVEETLFRHIGSDEAVVEVEPGRARRIARTVAALGPDAEPDAVHAAVAAAMEGTGDELLIEDVSTSLEGVRLDAWRRARAEARAAGLVALLPELAKLALVDALAVLDAPTALVEDGQGDRVLSARVSGLPVLHRGLSRSVGQNQLMSLGLALGLVLPILALLFRSAAVGLVAFAPTLLTLALVYGGMGLVGIRLDIGTSMLASLIIGSGVDFAVHLVAALRAGDGDGIRLASETVGPPIVTNALMVAAGFFVLTLGEARTLQNVGGLTSAAMLTAAVATFLTIPAIASNTLVRRHKEEEAGR